MEDLPQVALELRLRRRRGVEKRLERAGGSGLQCLERDEPADQRLGQRGVQGLEGEVPGEVEKFDA